MTHPLLKEMITALICALDVQNETDRKLALCSDPTERLVLIQALAHAKQKTRDARSAIPESWLI